MRLDHLLSRETAEGESRKLIPRSMRVRESESKELIRQRSCGSSRSMRMRARRPKSRSCKDAQRQGKAVEGKRLKEESRIGCIVFRVQALEEATCTLTTAQRERFEKGQLRNGIIGTGGGASRRPEHTATNRERQLVSGSSDEKIKLLRAQGGCPGTIRRRRTWQAAKSYGEPQAGVDP